MGVRIASADDMGAVRQLCRAYRDVLVERCVDIPEIVDAYYQVDAYETLLADLPTKHAAPDGAIFVGEMDDTVLACGMTHRIDETTCEIKRVYVDPAGRGSGLASGIFDAAMDQARIDGYSRMVLDTMINLHEAIALYHKLGFRPGTPFYDLNPRFASVIRFFEIDL